MSAFYLFYGTGSKSLAYSVSKPKMLEIFLILDIMNKMLDINRNQLCIESQRCAVLWIKLNVTHVVPWLWLWYTCTQKKKNLLSFLYLIIFFFLSLLVVYY